MLYECASALYPSIRDLADLRAVEQLPLPLTEECMKVDNTQRRQEVEEGVPHITLVFEVNGQVKEVVLPSEVLVNGVQEKLLGVLVGDVLDHDGGARVLVC